MSLAIQFSILAGVSTFLLVLAAEGLHARRQQVVAHLASGPDGQPRSWTRLVPWVRASSLGAIAWALTTLFFAQGNAFTSAALDREEDTRDRIVFLADLSPSMHITDAGPNGDQSRGERMYDVVDAVLKRLNGDVLFSVVGFYTDAIPAIIDAEDPELVRNIFAGLPVWYVMESGKTDLGIGIRESLKLLRKNADGRTTVFICTDGDTLPLSAIPKPPAAIRDVYVLGVGDPNQGTFIDDHMSRQDTAVLRLVAGRLSGQYLDVNKKHVPTLSMGALAQSATKPRKTYGLIEIALLVLATAAVIHALIPVALEFLGSSWRTVRPPKRVETHRKVAAP